VFAADEYHLMAGRPFPALAEYEDLTQHENGIGMARVFEAEVQRALSGDSTETTGTRSGFFAWVDGAPPEGYRAPRQTMGALAVRDARVDEARRPVTVLTGTYGKRVLTPMLPALTERAGTRVTLMAVENQFFGGNIGVTGLLTGGDVARALADVDPGDRVLLPDVTLSNDRFLDGTSVADLPRPVEVVATDGASLVEAL
jgi:NifB/MoaA-like Fe-S oxidoreductase